MLQHHGTFTIIYCTTITAYDNMIIYEGKKWPESKNVLKSKRAYFRCVIIKNKIKSPNNLTYMEMNNNHNT